MWKDTKKFTEMKPQS